MGIGASLLLFAVGAILAFAVDYSLAGVDIALIGWILMGAGCLGLLATLAIWMPRRVRNSPAARSAPPRRDYTPEPYRPEQPRRAEMAYRSEMPRNDVEYFAGTAADGREVWLVGRVERRERRGDGEWLYMRPTQPYPGTNTSSPGWVSADDTRTLPRYDR
ncbi:DUF6458 family protein [Actinopolymorpha rutila]|uniref:DUF6458 domain-containing protein n=1 Tax=Actinopolymorpha rutila TaxID=446787 RepID=A0A852ZKU7_9ACTN|nr:DUF6458 family protein [Actinopolymorpha rutila]NYH92232.1 hypothetical protein [Actinopolymorpha rutila]